MNHNAMNHRHRTPLASGLAVLLLLAPAAPAQDDHAGHADHGDGDDHASEGSHAGEEAHADEVHLTADAVERYGVTVAPAARSAPVDSFSAPARVGFNAEATAHVGSAVEGRVAEVKVRLGDRAERGDVLLTVDSPELGRMQGEYLADRTAVETSRPAVELAQDAYDRARKLYDAQGGLSLTEVQKRQADLAAARRELLRAEAEVSAAGNTLRLYGMDGPAVEALATTGEIDPRYAVVAPLDGEVVEREVTLGELVGPASEKLMVLADLSTVWVLVDVPEVKLANAGIGSRVLLEVPSVPGRAFEGKVTYVAPQVEESTRTARLRVEVENAGGALKPGMFARATVSPPGESAMVLAVPAGAVLTVEGGPCVFVAVEGEANTFAKRPVSVGPTVGGVVPILSGLAEGEPVVTAGAFILKAELGKAGVEHDH